MLEFLRRQTKPIMIALAVIIIIAFTFTGNSTGSRPPGQRSAEDKAFEIYGKEYSFADLSRLQRFYPLASGLQLPVGRNSFADSMAYIVQRYQSQDRIPADFAFNLLVLRKNMAEHGIQISNAEAREAFRALPAFQNQGQVDGSRVEQFLEALRQQGYVESDVFELLKDWVGYQKLQEVVAGNTVVDRHVATQFYNSSFQTLKVASIPFAVEDFKKDATVTDEEVQKYYEEKKDSYMTAEKRAVKYVYFANPDTTKLNAEETVKTRNDFAAKVNDFGVAVITPDANLDEEAKKAGVEVKSLPAFSMDAAPDAVKDEFMVVMEMFRTDPKLRPVSDPVQGEKGYYFYTVTEIVAPKQQELAEVKDKIREELVSQKAQELMTKAANEARKKLEESIKGGKKFEEAAKEAGLTPQMLPEFTPSSPPADLSNGAEIADEARYTPAGSFTKPLPTANGILLVYVVAKDLYKRDDSATMRTNIEQSLDAMTQNDVFRAWFERRRADAKENADEIMKRAMGM